MKRIGLIINKLNCGGTENQAVLLANAFTKHYETDLILISARYDDDFHFLPKVEKSVNLINLTKGSHLASVKALYTQFKNTRYDFVLNYSDAANLVGAVIPRLAGNRAPIYCNIRGDRPLNYKNISIWRHFATGVFTNSEKIQERLLEQYKYKKKINIVNNGIGFRDFDKKVEGKDRLNIIVVGRIHPVKNQLDIVRAAHQLNGAPLSITLVGGKSDDEYFEELEQEIKILGVNSISFAGAHKELDKFYSSADLLVLNSWSEGFPNVLLEAFNYLVPVISSNVGQVPKIIDPGKNGFLYEPGDVDSLVELIKKFQNMSVKEKETMQDNIRETIKKFSIDSIVLTMKEIMESETLAVEH